MPKLPEKEPKWNPVDYAEYLKATSLGPIDGEVKKLAERIAKGKKTVLAKARAIYDWTVENMYRDPNTRGCGLGDVCALIIKPGGKCTDISSMYIALCRAAGVPAREIFGIRLGKKAEEEITTWQHCWVEFFLPGTGWVPVDPADVRKAILVEKLEMTDPKVKEYREYFWGGIDPYRFRLAVGRDLVLNPRQTGAPLNTFGYPYAEIGGQPLDFYDPKSFTYSIIYREK
jgi:transglutaminase-like putative cysteine protease